MFSSLLTVGPSFSSFFASTVWPALPWQLTIDGDFMDDMGLDSLDVVECVMAIEEEFSIELDDTQAEIIRSPKEMIAFIMAH